MASRLVCAGCGVEPDPNEPYPFRCPNADGHDGIDHVLRRGLDPALVAFPDDPGETNPYVRYRGLLHAYHLGRANGLTDEELVGLVRTLDERVAAADALLPGGGTGFRATPFARADRLSDALGFSSRGGIWVKDETRNVSGSHKARHLFGVLLQLEVVELLGWVSPRDRPRLAIASCGNAALAAAVLARAAGRPLDVFVPPDADPAVVAELGLLGAFVVTCAREEGRAGDPTYLRLLEALSGGSLPFTCQGNLNGLAVEGGATLGYELVSDLGAAGLELDRIVVQVGGGALASAVFESLRDALALGALERLPRLDTIQTSGAWPLRRAYDLVRASHGSLSDAAHHRDRYMWPWATEPHSVAHGILDDETYDWLAVVQAMLATGGEPVVAVERTLLEAHRLAHATTEIDVDPTGAAGLAGLLALRTAREVGDDERVGLLFTGVTRVTPTAPDERNRDEKLPRQGHPVAQGLRAQ